VNMAAPASSSASTTGLTLPAEATVQSVRNYYGKVLQTSKDLKTSACTSSSKPSPRVLASLAKVPRPVLDKFYGCGTPLPTGIEGLRVLDLGSGSGRDCYVAADLVGEGGSVTGIDMTAGQLATARAHAAAYCTDALGYDKSNLTFLEGMIEFLGDAGVAPGSADLIISNCVINLSPDKPAVIAGCFAALRPGGELHFSDVYCSRRLPEDVRTDDVMLGECLGGALYVEDFRRICHRTGFADPRELTREEIIVTDPDLKRLVKGARFYSITYRCFKLPPVPGREGETGLETLCEDYGQVAYYLGTIEDAPTFYALDDHHVFETGRPMLVCGNTASMVGESWLKPHFRVVGDRTTHYGLFDCSGGPAPAAAAGEGSGGGGSCC